MELKKIDFSVVEEFEKQVADFFGAPYGVAVDSCTHGIELCLKYKNSNTITVPMQTYISVPMLANKIKLVLFWTNEKWEDYYYVNHTDRIIDAAVLWKKNSYVPNTFMCLSFQYQKHLSVGRGGMILTDNIDATRQLKKMSYDGRLPNIPWRQQNIDTLGYHYYMTPETANLGIERLKSAIDTVPKNWSYLDYPDLTKMDVFKI